MVGKTVLISSLNADSMINQAMLFKKLVEKSEYEAVFKSMISLKDLESDDVIAGAWFQLATINFIGDAIVPYILSDKPKFLYVTCEGYLTKGNVINSNITKCEFIAVSNYVRECLVNSGLKVKKVVHHAVDWRLCGEIRNKNQYQKRQIDNYAKDKIKFIVVARHDPRKNLKNFAEALKILNDKGYQNDYIVFLITDESAKELFEGINNVVFIKPFGGSSHELILGYIASCDYLIHPAVCEGFGLPVLEANAVGIPAIHCDFPPLNEFSSSEFNFTFSYIDKQIVKANAYQNWIFHLFTPDMLAEVIAYAIDVYKNSKDEYNEYCIKAREWTKNWDYHIKYAELMKELKLKIPAEVLELINLHDDEIIEIN